MRLKPHHTSAMNGKRLTAKKITKMVHDAVAVDIGWTGKAIVGGVGVLLSAITFICSMTFSQVEKIDTKLFKHLTNDEIHMPSKQITPMSVYEEHIKYDEKQLQHTESVLTSMESRFCQEINSTRNDLKSDLSDLKDYIRELHRNDNVKGK